MTLVAAVAALLGATLQSATGFGFALLSAPLLVAVLGPRTAVSTMVVLSLAVNVLTIAGERRRPDVLVGEALALVAWTLPGLVLGVVALRALPARALEVLVAIVVLAAVGLRLRLRAGPGPRVRASPPPRAAPAPPAGRTAAAGLASGALSTSTGVGGPVIVVHLLGRGLAPPALRDTLAAVFLGGGVLSLGVLLASRTFDLPPALPLLLAATVAGHLVGRRAFAALGEATYERAVLALLAVTALAALVASVV